LIDPLPVREKKMRGKKGRGTGNGKKEKSKGKQKMGRKDRKSVHSDFGLRLRFN